MVVGRAIFTYPLPVRDPQFLSKAIPGDPPCPRKGVLDYHQREVFLRITSHHHAYGNLDEIQASELKQFEYHFKHNIGKPKFWRSWLHVWEFIAG